MGTAYLLALDFLAPQVPPERDSKQDVQLVRAANLACQRHRAGIADRVLFIVCGACDQGKVAAALGSYGFPVLDLRFVGEHDDMFCNDQGSVSWDQELARKRLRLLMAGASAPWVLCRTVRAA